MHKITVLIAISLIAFSLQGYSQAYTGQWQSYLSYRNGTSVADAGDRIWCGTTTGLFSYDRKDNSIQTYSKCNGLSDNGIKAIKYHNQLKALVIAYENGNIDILKDNKFHNYADIVRSQISGEKTINNIDFIDNYAYLSCSFGIVVFDLIRNEIKDTYYIGDKGASVYVYDIALYNNRIYAATKKGLYFASATSQSLSNFEEWQIDTLLSNPNISYNAVVAFNGKLHINYNSPIYKSDTMYVFDGKKWDYLLKGDNLNRSYIENNNNHLVICDIWQTNILDSNYISTKKVYTYISGKPKCKAAIYTNEGDIFIADNESGLAYSPKTYFDGMTITPEGPFSNNIFASDCKNGNLWVAPGGHNQAWVDYWNKEGSFNFNNGKWSFYNYKNYSPELDSIYDIINIAVDPNDGSHAFGCSWTSGLIEYKNGKFHKLHNEKNSTLQSILDNKSFYKIGIGGAAFDKNGNVWVTNAGIVDYGLHVLKTDGTWQGFDIRNVRPDGPNEISSLIVDQSNQKWVILPRSNGLIVFTENGTFDNTSDDKYIFLGTGAGNGNLPSSNIFSIAEDLEGDIWIGTDKGIAVFDNAENVFNNQKDCRQITVSLEGYGQYLLEFESVNAIAVDGDNRKWIGTENAGVFLVSADGKDQLAHFTTENSPILSNSITTISINGENGEVFIGTDKGLMSFMSDASEGKAEYDQVQVFPNPVKSNYTGPIEVRGLATSSDIKITDVSGTLVFKGKSKGGKIIWDGNDFNGNKVKSGVYLVFCADKVAEKSFVAKIVVIN